MNKKYFRLFAFVLLTLFMATHGGVGQALGAAEPALVAVNEQIEKAWRAASTTAAFDYQTTIEQTTTPLLKLENAGRSPLTEHVYLEGSFDRAADQMQLRLWSEGGSTIFGNQALEIKVENGEAYGRAAGQAWQKIEDVTNLFAPGNDPLGFLRAATHVVQGEAVLLPVLLHSTAAEATNTYTPYTFEVDGQALAEYLRAQTEAQMRARGELPAGVELGAAEHFRDLTGHGEVWIHNDTGLPLRQVVTLAFPPDDYDQVSATLTTDFSNWQQPPANAWLSHVSGSVNNAAAQESAFALTATLFLAAGLWVLFQYRRHKPLYAAFVSVMILSFVVGPLLQNEQVYAYAARAQARQAEAEQNQAMQRERQTWETAQRANDFDPHQNPLGAVNSNQLSVSSNQSATSTDHSQSLLTDYSSPLTHTTIITPELPLTDDGTDTDNDGLTDVEEIIIETDAHDADSDNDGLTDSVEIYQLGTDPTAGGADSDGDTLPDRAEVLGFAYNAQQWYLDPLAADSNSDGVLDVGECAYNTGTATLTCPDTDNDGDPDVFDDDNDGDGVRDSVDLSTNFAAGNPTMGLTDDVFRYDLTGFGANLPMYVDFQLRPTDPDHLWYTLNVLDWPSNDQDGQVQRVHDTTFYDQITNTTTADSSPQLKDGDLRLLPMLEIEIPFQAGHYGNLPVKPGAPPITPTMPITAWLDTAATEAFGISVRHKDMSGTLAVYVPLILIEEDKDQGPVAFAGRMFYRPSSTDFGPTQKARLIWMVQAITDTCAPTPETYAPPGVPEDERRLKWCEDLDNWIENPASILHVYQDDWILTGFTTRENRGANASIIYQDPAFTVAQPAYTPGSFHDDNLWTLARGLERSYLTGRATTTARDLTLAGISTRFDKTQNFTSTAEQRWGIPRTAFFVEEYTFTQPSEFTAIPITYTQQILNSRFTSYAQSGAIPDPTLLFVREERFRTVGADVVSQTTIYDGGVFQNGFITTNGLSLSLDEAAIPEIVQAGLNWAPFRYQSGAWAAYPIEDYWVDKGPTFADVLADGVWTDPDDLEGARIIAQSFYLSLYSGLNQVIQIDTDPADLASQLTDSQLNTELNTYNAARLGWTIDNLVESFDSLMNFVQLKFGKALNNGLEALGFIVTVRVPTSSSTRQYRQYGAASGSALGSAPAPLKRLGEIQLTAWTPSSIVEVQTGVEYAARKAKKFGVAKIISKFGRYAHTGTVNLAHGLALMDTLAAVTQVVSTVGNFSNPEVDVALALAAIQFTASTLGLLDAVSVYVAWTARLNASEAATMWTKAMRFNVAATIFALLIVAVVAVGLFIFQIVNNDIAFGSLPFDKALAGLVASLIVAAVIIAIGSIPVFGQLIASIIGAIDATILLICTVLGTNQNPGSVASQWICPGITGLLTRAVEFLIYDQTPLVDLNNQNRLQLANLQFTFSDPAQGIAVNNALILGLEVNTALYRDPITGEDINFFLPYRYQFSNANVRESNFAYQIVGNEAPIHEGLTLGGMTASWQPPAPDSWAPDAMYVFTQTVASAPLTFTEAGLNRPLLGVYLAEGYRIHTQECWALPNPAIIPPLIPVCYLRAQADTTYIDLGSNILFDVFPATVGDFYTLAPRGNGYTLNWWSDQPVPALADADGDNLLSAARGGPDPNDSLPDTDGDGLSDFYELSLATDPVVADSDADGLNDYAELHANTNPYQADTDNDGLSDGEELAGWAFVYGYVGGVAQTTWVRSDPLQPDLDGDAYLDAEEKAYGFNPNLPSAGEILSLSSTLAPGDSVVKPGERIDYEVVLHNDLGTANLLGLLQVDVPPAVITTTLVPQVFDLDPQETLTTTGAVTVSTALTTSATISLTNVAGAVAVDLQDEISGRTLWLHLEETGTTYLDASNSGHNATCTLCPAPTLGFQNQGLVYTSGVSARLSLSGPAKAYGIARDSYTVLAWVKGSAWTGKQALLSELNANLHNFVLGFDAGRPLFNFSPISLTAPISLPTNAWHQVAWRYFEPTNEHAIFIDGVKVLTSTSVNYNYEALAEENFYLGITNLAGWSRLTAAVDEVEIFPYALSDDALTGKVGGGSGQVFYFDFEHEIDGFSTTPWEDGSAYRNQILCQEYAGDYFAQCPLSPFPGNPRPGFIQNGYRFVTNAGAEADILAVQANPNLDLSRGDGAFAISVWIQKLNDEGGWVMGNDAANNGYPSVWVDGDGIQAKFGPPLALCNLSVSGLADLSDPYADSRWHHLAATFDGVNFSVYLNNQQVGTVTCPLKKPGTANTFFIGNRANMVGNAFAGMIDELRIFNYGLLPEQVADLYWDTIPMLDVRFDESPARTAFADRSITPHAAICAGANCPLSGIQGRVNQTVWLDGGDDRIQLANAQALGMSEHSYTVMAWIKPEGGGQQPVLGSSANTGNDHPILGLNASNQPVFDNGASALTASATTLQNDRWYHVAWRFDMTNTVSLRGTLSILVDGVVVASLPNANALTGAQTLFLGRSATNFYDGMLDEVVIFRQALSEAKIQEHRDHAPTVNLHLDERNATLTFANEANSNNPADCTGSACPAAGIKGRVYQGIYFDGVNDMLTLDQINYPTFSLGGWVLPVSQKTAEQVLFDKSRASGAPMIRVAIAPNSMQVRVSLSVNSGAICAVTTVTSDAALIQYTWNHVLLTYDGDHFSLYLNGAQVLKQTLNAPTGLCSLAGVTTLGDSATSGTAVPFVGAMDEVVIYPSALTKAEVAELVAYQTNWADVSYAHNVLIDADAPSVSLGVTASYLPRAATTLAAVAHDATTAIVLVQYQINAGAWLSATADDDAWLFAFNPATNGNYNLRLRATDGAGNQITTTTQIVRVDGTPPTIGPTNVSTPVLPNVTQDKANQTWTVPLSGTITEAGSPLASVHITLLDSGGFEVSGGRLPANIVRSGGTTWNLAYPFTIRPNGVYTLHIEVADEVGNTASQQVGFQIDGIPPSVEIGYTGPISNYIGGPTTLTGTVQEVGVGSGVAKVEVSFQPAAHNDLSSIAMLNTGNVLHLGLDELISPTVSTPITQFVDLSGAGYSAVCSAPTCPQDSVRGKVGNAVQFDGVDDHLTVNGVSSALDSGALSFGAWVYPATGGNDVQSLLAFKQDNTVPLQLLTYQHSTQKFSYTDGVVGPQPSTGTFAPNQWHHVFVVIGAANNGTLYVNGNAVATFTTTVRPGPNEALKIGRAWDGATYRPFKGLLDDVAVYDLALSAAEIRRHARGFAPVLHLPLNDFSLAQGEKAEDASSYTNTVTFGQIPLVGRQFPVPGGVGTGAYNFSASVLTVTAASHLDLSGGEFTQLAWVYPFTNSAGPIISNFSTTVPAEQNYPFIQVTGGTTLQFGFGYGTGSNSAFASNVLTPNAWNFVAASFDGTTYRIYVNGALVNTSTALAGRTPFPAAQFSIGYNRFINTNFFFEGYLDEVQIFRQALPAAQIANLYRAGWQTTTVANPGANSTAWSFPVPSTLNGTYQIQLRTTDGKGNQSYGTEHFETWEGLIDNKYGSITLIKQAVPADGTNFAFTSNVTNTFSLDDASPDDGDGITNTRVITGLLTGAYIFTETQLAGWGLASLTCNSGSWNTDLANGRLTVNLAPGQHLICTFGNQKPADLQLVKSGPSGPVPVGAVFTYTLALTNLGPELAQNVVVIDTLPAETTYQANTCGVSGASGNVFTWPVGNLAPGATTCHVQVMLHSVGNGTITNTAWVTATTLDLNLANNTAVLTNTTGSVADLSVTQTVNALTALPGTPLLYTVTVTNLGPSPALGVILTDTFPVSQVAGVNSGGVCLPDAVGVTCALGMLGAGQTLTVSLTLTLTQTLSTSVFTNTVTVDSSVLDLNLSNNTASVSTVLLRRLYLPVIQR